MKKLETKSGRRASRKRQRMERLLEEVVPQRQGSGLLEAVQPSTKTPATEITPDSNAGHSSTAPKATDDLSLSDQSPKLESTENHRNNSRRLAKDQAARSSVHRQRRGQRIKEELRQQTFADPPVQETKSQQVANAVRKSTPQHDAVHDAGEAVRQISESPKNGNDPTATSMVAIAGAVTALASAIQFQLTEPQKQPQSTTDEHLTSPPKQSLPTTAANEDISQDNEQLKLPSKQISSSPKKQPAVVAAAVVAAAESQLAQRADADSEFDKSFFDDDESDVAGAYTVLPLTPQPVESYRDWFRRVVVRNKWATWFTAFYVHWLIILLMMMVFVHGPNQAANLLLNGAFADAPEIDTEGFDMSVDQPLAEPNAKEDLILAEPITERLTPRKIAEESLAISDAMMNQLSQKTAEETSDVTNETEVAEDHVKAASIPVGSVSQGSFSVWTEPEYPDAGEPYRIIVQIQLPPKTKSYHTRDLNGVVVGSDGYRKPIPGMNPEPLPIVDGCVRLVIPIVSADEQVKDTIFIRSKLLKETQKLLIEF